jgi:hypothetical protein
MGGHLVTISCCTIWLVGLLAANGLGHRRYLRRGLHNGLSAICHVLSFFWLPTASAISATSVTASTTASSAISFPSFGCQQPRPSPRPLPRPPQRPLLPRPSRLLAANGLGHRRCLCHGLHHGLICHILSVFGRQRPRPSLLPPALPPLRPSSATSFPLWPAGPCTGLYGSDAYMKSSRNLCAVKYRGRRNGSMDFPKCKSIYFFSIGKVGKIS